MSPEEKAAQALVAEQRQAQQAVEQAEKDKIKAQEQKVLAEKQAAAQAAEAEQLSANAVSSRTLWKAYDANEVAADAKYKDKKIMIKGQVTDISKDVFGNPTITLPGDGSGMLNVICQMKDEAGVAELSKGQTVAVVGVVKGFVISSVTVDDCVLVK